MKTNGYFFSGTSGLALPLPRPGYPPGYAGKSRLEYFGTLFNSVEINSSFYKNPRASTIIKWAGMVPGDFKFSFKLSKAITHAKPFHPDSVVVDAFIENIGNIGNKKGCILIQFPPSFKGALLNLVETLLSMINTSGGDWKVAVEFRNSSWYQPETYQLLQQYNATIVIHDMPASATPGILPDLGFYYLRFHGENGRYRGSYSDSELNRYAINIREWLAAGKTVYCYFNNTMGDAAANLQQLNSLVSLC